MRPFISAPRGEGREGSSALDREERSVDGSETSRCGIIRGAPEDSREMKRVELWRRGRSFAHPHVK